MHAGRRDNVHHGREFVRIIAHGGNEGVQGQGLVNIQLGFEIEVFLLEGLQIVEIAFAEEDVAEALVPGQAVVAQGKNTAECKEQDKQQCQPVRIALQPVEDDSEGSLGLLAVGGWAWGNCISRELVVIA